MVKNFLYTVYRGFLFWKFWTKKSVVACVPVWYFIDIVEILVNTRFSRHSFTFQNASWYSIFFFFYVLAWRFQTRVFKGSGEVTDWEEWHWEQVTEAEWWWVSLDLGLIIQTEFGIVRTHKLIEYRSCIKMHSAKSDNNRSKVMLNHYEDKYISLSCYLHIQWSLIYPDALVPSKNCPDRWSVQISEMLWFLLKGKIYVFYNFIKGYTKDNFYIYIVTLY